MTHPGSMATLVRILRNPPVVGGPRFADMIAGNLDTLLIAAVNGMADPSDRARRRTLVRQWRRMASTDGGNMPAIALIALESLLLAHPFYGCRTMKERLVETVWAAATPEGVAHAMAGVMWGSYGVPGCGVSMIAALSPAVTMMPDLPGPDDGTVISWTFRASLMVQSLSETLSARPLRGMADALADLAMASARPGAPDMRMPGKATTDMLAVPVDMILDGLPTMMAVETLAAETAR